MKTELTSKNLAETLDSIEQSAKKASSPERALLLRLLAEEAISSFQTKPIKLFFQSEETGFHLELQHTGEPFDPIVKKDEPHVRLLHHLADSLDYRRENEINILTLRKGY